MGLKVTNTFWQRLDARDRVRDCRDQGMELRRVKALLDALKVAGVATYEDLPDGGVKLSFAAPLEVVPGQASTDRDGDMDLPDGVLDPRKEIARIYAKKTRRAT